MSLDYKDFSGLLILAIGINASYSASRKIDEFLFEILSLIKSIKQKQKKLIIGTELINGIVDNVGKMKKLSLNDLQLDFGKEGTNTVNNFDSEEFKAECSNVKNELSNFQKYIDNNSLLRRENLRNATFLSAFYAFCVTLLAPYNFFQFNETLFITNIYLLLMSIIFVVLEKFNKKVPFKLIPIFCLPIILFLLKNLLFIEGCWKGVSVTSPKIICYSILDYNCIFTVLVCFVSPFIYTLFAILASNSGEKIRYEELLTRIEKIEEIKSYTDKFSLMSLKKGKLKMKRAD